MGECGERGLPGRIGVKPTVERRHSPPYTVCAAMPGDQPSNGKVREPVTIRNGSICTQKHVYEHPWETVLAAYDALPSMLCRCSAYC